MQPQTVRAGKMHGNRKMWVFFRPEFCSLNNETFRGIEFFRKFCYDMVKRDHRPKNAKYD